MKKITIIILFLFGSTCIHAQAPAWTWAKKMYSSYGDEAKKIAVDIAGNLYVLGEFHGAIINIGTFNVNNHFSSGYSFDIYIAKYDPAGNALWARGIGCPGIDRAGDIAVDNNGFVYATGMYAGPSVTFGSITLNGGGGTFIVKYDTSGNAIWANEGTGSYNAGTGIITDVGGNVYVTGYYESPGVIFDSYSAPNSIGATNMFLVKLNSSGNAVWLKWAQGDWYTWPNDIAADASGIYVTGTFSGDYTAFETLGVYNSSNNYMDIFVVKYNFSGLPQWVFSAGDLDDDVSTNLISIGNYLYMTGYFGGDTIAFGNTHLVSTWGPDMFVVKFNGSGNIIWAKSSAGGSNYETGNGVAVDIDGGENVYVTGGFTGVLNFGSYSLHNTGLGSTRDIYIVKYNSSGNVMWAKSVSAPKEDMGMGVAVDDNDNVYIVGDFFSDSITFDLDVLHCAWSIPTSSDAFIAKIPGTFTVGLNESVVDDVNLFPNPTTNELTIENGKLKIEKVELYNMLGEKIYERHQTSDIGHLTISVADFLPGIYFITVTDEAGNKMTKKIVKM